jgi:hypothetical protein
MAQCPSRQSEAEAAVTSRATKLVAQDASDRADALRQDHPLSHPDRHQLVRSLSGGGLRSKKLWKAPY